MDHKYRSKSDKLDLLPLYRLGLPLILVDKRKFSDSFTNILGYFSKL